MQGLTPRQRQLLNFIKIKIATDGYCPSYKEMAAGMGMSAKSIGTVSALVDRLEERGYIERSHIKGSSRSIRVLEA